MKNLFTSALLTLLLLNALPFTLQAAGPGDPENQIDIYANPFRKWVRVELQHPLSNEARLELYDDSGNRVKVVAPASDSHFVVEQGRLTTGYYSFRVVEPDHEPGSGRLFFGR